jgi:hypothetical protein
MDWDGDRVEATVSGGEAEGLLLGAEHLLGVSRSVCPIEEGTLIRSSGTDVDGDSASVYYDTVYARYQHERLDLRHDPGRQAKYLEEPAETEAPVIFALIAGALGDTFR